MTSGRLISWFGPALLAFTSVATAAPAPETMPLFLADSPFGTAPTTIYTVDPSSGAMRAVAALDPAFTPVLGLAAANGSTLYAAASDTTPSDLCLGTSSCLLIRIVLAPGSTTPQNVSIIGPVRTSTGPVTEITGLSFRPDGRLFGVSQLSSALYAIDTDTAVATEVGSLGITQHGGDITFDAGDHLWAWSNIEAAAGLYELNPDTGAASAFELHPFMNLAGLTAVGHGERAFGACAETNRLVEVALPIGVTGNEVQLLYGGLAFDHTRGDLDSPYCTGDAACDDGVFCTRDSCRPGGCVNAAIPGCCVADADCVDGNACTILEHCVENSCVSTPDTTDADQDGMPDCRGDVGPFDRALWKMLGESQDRRDQRRSSVDSRGARLLRVKR
jgi:hypothetical protein